MAKPTLLKNVKEGQYFCFSMTPDEQKEEQEVKSGKVWVRGSYDRELKKYEVYMFANIGKYKFVKGDRIVWTDIFF